MEILLASPNSTRMFWFIKNKSVEVNLKGWMRSGEEQKYAAEREVHTGARKELMYIILVLVSSTLSLISAAGCSRYQANNMIKERPSYCSSV